MRVLGTKFFGHDSALVYIDTEARTVFGASVERFTRVKHDELDVGAILSLLPEIQPQVVAHSYSGFGGFDPSKEKNVYGAADIFRHRIIRDLGRPKYRSSLNELNVPEEAVRGHLLFQVLEKIRGVSGASRFGLCNGGSRHAAAVEMAIGLAMPRALQDRGVEVVFEDHHLCHALAAYHFSPFTTTRAVVVTLDGWGDDCFGRTYLFEPGLAHVVLGSSPAVVVDSPEGEAVCSLGELYASFTAALGFVPGSDEGKVEALAAFGASNQKLYEQMRGGVRFGRNAMFMDSKLFAPLLSPQFVAGLRRSIGDENLAATIQTFLQDLVVEFINSLRVPAGVDAICLAGGVAANVVMNMHIHERAKFRRMFVCPFMGDEGTAMGAALLQLLYAGDECQWITSGSMPYFGCAFSEDEVREACDGENEIVATDVGVGWADMAASDVAAKRVIGLFQGRMEFGPRALGNRSIIGNAADPLLRERLNVSIKRRPHWQPFCPSVLEEDREEIFESSFPHKHMAIAFRVRDRWRDRIPSAVHVDGTARPQFVEFADNPNLFALLLCVKARTGIGVVVNTSFNLHGRTIVRTPRDALDDFLACDLDALYFVSAEGRGLRVRRRR
jgi:carbamoyltransferase